MLSGLVGQVSASLGSNHRLMVFGGSQTFFTLQALLGEQPLPTAERLQVRTLDFREGIASVEQVYDLAAPTSCSIVSNETHAIFFGGCAPLLSVANAHLSCSCSSSHPPRFPYLPATCTAKLSLAGALR